MAEEKNYSSIGPLNTAAQKEGITLLGTILLVMVVTIVATYVIGEIANRMV